nr:hypothetical protein [Nanoarchaeum sp.]
TTDFFKDFEAERVAELDYNHRHQLKLNIKDNNLEKRIYHHYGSKAARTIVASLFAYGYHELWKKPVKIDKFKEYTSKAFEDYCSMKGIEEGLARKIKRLSLNETEVGHLIDRKWFKNLYEIKDKKIKLKCNLKVISPKI